MELRKAYVNALADLMRKDDKIVVLDADLSSAGGTKPLYEEFPDRTFDCGIAESNMTSIAAGLAASGFIPFIHTFAPFASRRNFDQIAVSVSYSELPVKIVGFDPGITATLNGGTHMCFEDVAAMRALPNIAVEDVVDGVQLSKALSSLAYSGTPVYIRFARKQTDEFYGNGYVYTFGKADLVQEGRDISIIASGASAFDARDALRLLHEHNVFAELIAVHTLKPLDEAAVLKTARKTGKVLTVENHNVHGGLYGAVTEVLSREYPVKCKAVAVYDRIGQVGQLDELKRDYHLSADDIVTAALELLG